MIRTNYLVMSVTLVCLFTATFVVANRTEYKKVCFEGENSQCRTIPSKTADQLVIGVEKLKNVNN